MNVLSLFDGMSGGQIALTNMGVKIDNYYASEIDKHAIAQTQLNFPNTKQLGSVTEWQTWNIDWSSINILFAGSPCQGFSFAGKQLAFDDPRSKLFFVFVDILNHIRKFNPDVLFLLENVKMKSEHEAVITQYCGVNPIEINSALLSAQNRVRLYWTNIGVVKRGLFNEYYPGIPQPKDKGILLRGILETDVAEKYYLSDKMLNYFNRNDIDCKEKGTGFRFAPEKKFDVKSKTITSKEGTQMQNNFIVASRGRNPENPKSRVAGLPTEQQLEPRNDGKTNCLTSVQKDNLVMQFAYKQDSPVDENKDKYNCLRANGGGKLRGVGLIVKSRVSNHPERNLNIKEATSKGYTEIAPGECFDFENPNSETRRGRKMEDKSNRLMASETKFMQYTKDYRIRRLTPTECARLQTIPTWYKWQCSDTQQYRMLGNGWTNDVIEWILSFAKF